MEPVLRNPPLKTVRPVDLRDAGVLQHTCWPDRSLVSVTAFVRRAARLRTQQRGLGAVAIDETDAICGFGLLTLWPRTAEISDLIVPQRCRGEGIGSALIIHLADAAHDLGAAILEIGAALSNPRALALYRRLGFSDHHTVQLELGNGPETVLYLEKSLLLE